MFVSRPILPAEAVRDLLREHGLRVTRQRETLYSALASTSSHPTADELLGLVQGRAAGISLATIYNTLEAFVDAGLCKRIHAGSATRYDASTSDHAHVQTSDGRVLDLPEALSRKIQRAIDPAVLKGIEDELGVRVASISFSVTDR